MMGFRLGLLLFLLGVQLLAAVPAVPLPAREFRGAWIATVRCINWPSEPGLPTAKQKEQLLTLLDRAVAMRLNAIIFQVRPAADALYRSQIEPWSPWLTGKMGTAPETLWDPLEFAVTEAHARGLELHAWFNPFRALSGTTKFPASPTHVTKTHPDWCFAYAEHTWMNPGLKEVRDRAKQVMLDVVQRYDVDGIHFDDYFYPYPEKGADGQTLEIPDAKTYAAYEATGGKLGLTAWRRECVDAFVRQIYVETKQLKKWVQVGISPFGLWRPNHPPGSGGGLDPYEVLAADSRKWLQQGWVDYLVPQLYWHTDDKKLSFPMYYDWWKKENTLKRHLYPGMAVDRVGVDRGGIEILRQLSSVRQKCSPLAPGHLHWNLGELLSNKMKVADLVLERAYGTVAIPPATPWLSKDALPQTVLVVNKVAGKPRVQWSSQDPRLNVMVRRWLLQVWDGKVWKAYKVFPSDKLETNWPAAAKAVAVRPLGKCWEVGAAIMSGPP